MKKMFFLFLSVAVAGVFTANAQGGQGRSVEERVKAIMDKFADFKLDKSTSDKVDTVFGQYFRAQRKVREDMTAGGGQPDRQAMMEKMQPLMTDRDDKLKKLLSADQFKKWKDEIEPSLRQRPGGGGGGGNGSGGN